MPRKNYDCKCCPCEVESEGFVLAADEPFITSSRETAVEYVFDLPGLFDGLTPVPVEITAGFGGEAETAANPKIQLRVSRIIGTPGQGPWSSLMFGTASLTNTQGFFEFPLGRIKPLTPFHLEFAITVGDAEPQRVFVPLVPGQTDAAADVSYPFVGATIPVAHNYPMRARLTCRIKGGFAYAEAKLYNVELLNPQGLGSSVVPHEDRWAVRHLFEPVEIDSWGNGSSIVSDVSGIEGAVMTYRTGRELTNALPTGPKSYCVPMSFETTPERDESYRSYPFIRTSECDFRPRTGHVTHALDGTQFSELVVDAGLDEPLVLTRFADDGTPLADGTFWFAGQATSDAGISTTAFPPVWTEKTFTRVEAAAAFYTFPRRPCGSVAPQELSEQNWITFITLALRFDGNFLQLNHSKVINADGTVGTEDGIPLTLSFDSCFGDGAQARVVGPTFGGAQEGGPITALEIVDGGSGYAIRGRSQPTVTVSGTSGDGDDATFTVTLTEIEDDCGVPHWEVSSVEMDGGEGYAPGDQLVFAVADGDTQQAIATATILEPRGEPTLTASAADGSGAEFEIEYAEIGPAPTTWEVSAVSVTNGGSGYSDGAAVTFSLGDGDTEDEAAVAVIETVIAEPTLEASVAGGTGAELTIAYASLTSPAGWYRVSSITVDDGGTGYTDGASVTFTLGDGDEVKPGFTGASAEIRTSREAPADDWTIASDAGSGLQLSISLEQFTYGGRPAWRATSASVVNGGTGYSVGDFVSVTANNGETVANAFIEITSVGGGGAVTGVQVDAGNKGIYWEDTGEIESVVISVGGVYRNDTGEISGVTVSSGGAYYKATEGGVSVDDGGYYYRNDDEVPPYVADVEVSVVQQPPAPGTGAQITATVDDDPESDTFGEIISLAIESGGNGYKAKEPQFAGFSFLSGEEIPVQTVQGPYFSGGFNRGHSLELIQPADEPAFQNFLTAPGYEAYRLAFARFPRGWLGNPLITVRLQ